MTRQADRLPAAAVVFVAAWAAILLLAPPESNYAWAVNGTRSILPVVAIALAAAAVTTAFLAFRPRLEPWAIAAIGLALAFPLRERVHLLGDTGLRHRLLEALAEPSATVLSTGGLARVLHSQPLDALCSVAIPVALARAGVPVGLALAVVGALLFAGFYAGVRRAVEGGGALNVAALAAAASFSGLLQLYAGYADGWGLTLAVAAWWWWSLDRPHPSPGRALITAGLWLALVLGHRLGWVMLAPMAWRALGPARPGDGPRARAWLAGGTVAAVAIAAALSGWSGGSKLPQDMADFAATLTGPGGPRVVAVWDLANLLVLVMPLALLAPALAGRGAMAAFARTPSALLFAVALVPLLPMLLLFPMAPHGLGVHRDWDLAALPGLLAGLAAARVFAHAGEARTRRALALALPLLALQAGSWLAVNADPGAGARRAFSIVSEPGALRGEQASHAQVFLGYRAAGLGEFAASARHFERSARELPNPRHELFAAQAWLAAGDLAAARAAYDRALGYAPFPPDVQRTAETVGAMLAEAARQAP